MRRRGFTFIELMLSILIMIGSSVIVTQGLSRWTGVSETRAAVAETGALLRRASSQALGFGRPYIIKLTSAGVASLQGTRWNVGADGVSATFVPDRTVVFPKRVLSVTLPGAKSTLVIDSGGPSVDAPVKLRFAEGAHTVEWTVTLSADGQVSQSRVEK